MFSSGDGQYWQYDPHYFWNMITLKSNHIYPREIKQHLKILLGVLTSDLIVRNLRIISQAHLYFKVFLCQSFVWCLQKKVLRNPLEMIWRQNLARLIAFSSCYELLNLIFDRTFLITTWKYSSFNGECPFKATPLGPLAPLKWRSKASIGKWESLQNLS